MDRYLVISSDTHAGPPSEAYRDYIDPQHREAFDRDLETALALRSVILESASEEQAKFREEWEEETGDGGTARLVRPRRPQRRARQGGHRRRGDLPRRRRARRRRLGAVQRRAAVARASSTVSW